MGRSKTYLVAIALAIGLTSAQGQPAPHESLGPKGVLTAARQKVLMEVLTKRNIKSVMAPKVATSLGLTNGTSLTLTQVGVQTDDGVYHSYSPLPDGGVLLGLTDNVKALDYRMDITIRLVAAVRAQNNTPTDIPLSAAQAAAENEVKYWADVADQLQDGK